MSPAAAPPPGPAAGVAPDPGREGAAGAAGPSARPPGVPAPDGPPRAEGGVVSGPAPVLRLRHPGPRAAARRLAVPADLRPVAGVLRRGGVLMAEVAALFAAAGARGGVLFLDGVTCEPFRYVLPALATDVAHAAWYSQTHAPEGPVTIATATASVGWRDGAPFLHGHGRWMVPGGEAMGHVLPFESRLAADAEVTGFAAPGAWFEALPDAETNFTLFTPAGGDATGAGLLLRLCPDEDVATAIEAAAAAHGLARARVHGLGSICGVVFDDGRRVDCVATEVRIDDGRLADGRCTLDISVVDVAGGIHAGRLLRGQNPVGVTFEIALVPA